MSNLRVEKIWVAQKATVDKRVNSDNLRDLAALKATVSRSVHSDSWQDVLALKATVASEDSWQQVKV